MPSSPQAASGLAQPVGASARTYDRAASLKTIRTRYEHLMPPVRRTLKHLVRDESFMVLAAELRSQGWKDWHLLTAIANIVVNYRAVERGINMTTSITPGDIKRFNALMTSEERPTDSVVPIDQFSSDAMWFHLANAARATAEAWGLDVRINPIEPRAFLDVLGSRFNYWSDDVEHLPVLE